MKHLIYGPNSYINKTTLSKIIRENRIDESSINRFIYKDESTIINFIDKISIDPLLVEKELVILYEPSFLEAASKINASGWKNIIKIIEGSSEKYIIVFISSISKLSRDKRVKLITEEFKIHESKELLQKDIMPWVKQRVEFEDFTFDNDALISFCNKMPLDLDIIKSELQKLFNISLTNRKINIENVKETTTDYGVVNYFGISNAITSKDKNQLIKELKLLQNDGADIFQIIGILASQLSAIKVALWYRENKDQETYLAETGVHPYRGKLLYNQSGYNNVKEINMLIKKLYDIEYSIKVEGIDQFAQLELFIFTI